MKTKLQKQREALDRHTRLRHPALVLAATSTYCAECVECEALHMAIQKNGTKRVRSFQPWYKS